MEPDGPLRSVLADPTFDRRFELLREAGSGGMGQVYEARDRETGRRLAIKVLANPGADGTARFTAEAEILEGLSHPRIVAYVAHGVTGRGDPYLAMEWVDGETLAHRLAREPLSVPDVLAIAHQLADALVFAHAAGIIHRDVKPSNIILVGGRPDDLRLADFGIAKTAARDLTHTGQLVGTPGYMAPEQALGRQAIDGRADLFALGCVLYESLARTSPFSGEEVMQILAKLLLHEPAPIESLRPEIPARLANLVTSLLGKDLSARMDRAADVVAEVALIEEALAAGDEAALAARPVLVPGGALAPTLAAAPARGRSRRWWWAAGIATLAAAAGVIAFVLQREDAPEAPCSAQLRAGRQARGERGDGEACYYHGDALLRGLAGPPEPAAGITALLRGCERESGKACTKAGAAILELGDRGRAPPGLTVADAQAVLERGCARDSASTCRRLGIEHLGPDGHFTKDDHAAFAALSRACELADQPACWKLADLQTEGRGTPAERARAGAAIDAACAAGARHAACRR